MPFSLCPIAGDQMAPVSTLRSATLGRLHESLTSELSIALDGQIANTVFHVSLAQHAGLIAPFAYCGYYIALSRTQTQDNDPQLAPPA
jgi:hypothetical protein